MSDDDIIEAKVAEVIADNQVALNAGSNSGVREGAHVTLYNDFAVVDPDTKEPLGEVRVPKLELLVDHVQERLSVARVISVTGERTTFADIVQGAPTTKKITTRSSEVSSKVVLVKVGEDADIENR